MKNGDKVEVLRKSKFGNNWVAVGKGYATNVLTDKFGCVSFISYSDKDSTNPSVTEIIAVNADSIKVRKC